MASTNDAWGELAMKQPNGASYEFFEKLLPPSAVIAPIPGVSIPTGQLSIASDTTPVKFTAQGLDYGYALSSVSSGKSVTYQ
jgi:hypothetical protein